MICTNCDEPMGVDDKTCPNCGGRQATKRVSPTPTITMTETPWAVFNPDRKAVWITMDSDQAHVICAFLRAWCGVVHPEWEEFEAAGWSCVQVTITPAVP